MRPRLLRWVVFFFRRPVRLADFAVLLRLFRSHPKGSAETSAEPREPAPEPLRKLPGKAATPGRLPAVSEPPLGVDVSEQPLDTLPAELQVELLVTAASAAAADPSSLGGVCEFAAR